MSQRGSRSARSNHVSDCDTSHGGPRKGCRAISELQLESSPFCSWEQIKGNLKRVYETFPPKEARRILSRLEFHYTPKHASWLNMVEIEIGVLRQQCLDRRIDNTELLESETAIWCADRNAQGAKIKWMFDVSQARTKMRRAYPRLEG